MAPSVGAAYWSGAPRDGVCNSSCLTIVVSGLRAACPSHLTLKRLRSWVMGICPVLSSSSAVEGPGTGPSCGARRSCGNSPVWQPGSS